MSFFPASIAPLKWHKIIIYDNQLYEMPENTINDLKIKLDLLQDKVWTNEEKTNKYLRYIASQVSKLKKLKVLIEENKHRILKLEKNLDKGGVK
jgi:DNA repair exonuclease SbcCD ATPase subunit